MDYVQLYISWFSMVDVMKSPGRVDFNLVAIWNASAYSNGVQLRYFDFLGFPTMTITITLLGQDANLTKKIAV